MTLTWAGERLLPYATQVVRLMAEAERAVLSIESPCGSLRLGSMETTAALRLPKLLATYANRYPEVDIELELGPTEALLAAVLDRRVEAAFVAGPIRQEKVTTIPVLNEELVLVAEAKFQSSDQVLAMLTSRRDARVLVFKTGCTYRQRLEHFLAAHGLVHVRRMEFGTLDGIISCIEAGMGVSMLPRVVAAAVQESGRVSVHALTGESGSVQTLLIHRKDSLLTAAFERFLEHTRQAFEQSPHTDVSALASRVRGSSSENSKGGRRDTRPTKPQT